MRSHTADTAILPPIAQSLLNTYEKLGNPVYAITNDNTLVAVSVTELRVRLHQAYMKIMTEIYNPRISTSLGPSWISTEPGLRFLNEWESLLALHSSAESRLDYGGANVYRGKVVVDTMAAWNEFLNFPKIGN